MKELAQKFIEKLKNDRENAKLLVAKLNGAVEAIQVLLDEHENSESKRIQEAKESNNEEKSN